VIHLGKIIEEFAFAERVAQDGRKLREGTSGKSC
jgi:hypothetical protein